MPNQIYNLIRNVNPSGAFVPEAADSKSVNAKVTKKLSTSFMDKIRCVAEKVGKVALLALALGITALLYWVNPSLFAIGFIAGVVFDEQVKEAIQKIKDVWNNQKIVGTLFGVFACGLSMPVTLATASLLWSAHFGSLMTHNVKEQKNSPAEQVFPGIPT